MDIAEAVLFCATRKPHVNIDDIIVNDIDMAGTYNAHKDGTVGWLRAINTCEVVNAILYIKDLIERKHI